MNTGVLVGRTRSNIAERLRMPALRNGYALVGSTLVTSALGGLYWVIAAHEYTPAQVGINASLISAMWFLTNLAHLNLTNALTRFVPTAGMHARRFISMSYATACVLSLAAATIFVIGVRFWSDGLGIVRDDPWVGFAFVAATAVWTIFVLQDSVLAGLQEGVYVLVENTLYGVVKIALLLGVAFVAPEFGIFWSWVLPLPILVVGVNLLVFRRLIPRQSHPSVVEAPQRAMLARFVAADYGSGLLWMAATSLTPILVLEVAGPDESAYVFTSWTIAYTLFLVSRSMGLANTAAAAREPHRLSELTRRTLTETARFVVPVVGGLVVFAPWILRVFGEEYARGGTTLLRLFALSAIPYLVTCAFLSVSYVQRRMKAIVTVTTSMAVSTLVFTFVFLETVGVVGVGIAWLLAQSIVALVIFTTEFRTLWVSRVNLQRIEPLLAGARSFAEHRRAPGLVQRAQRLVDSEPALAGEWRVEAALSSLHDVDLVTLRPRVGDDPAILRMPRTRQGLRTVVRHTGVLLSLDRQSLTFAELLPNVLAEGLSAPEPWMLEQRIDGHPAGRLLPTLGPEPLIAMTVDAMRPLHEHALRNVVVDNALFAAMVDDPIAQMRQVPSPALNAGRDAEACQRLRAELREELLERTVPVGFVHGDLWLGNILVDPRSGAVCGIIDWDRAHEPGLVHADVMHLLLATRAAQANMEIGEVVVRALASDEWAPHERAALDSTAGLGACPLPTRTLLLLAWLAHVSGLPEKSVRYKKSLVWRARNTELVLEQL